MIHDFRHNIDVAPKPRFPRCDHVMTMIAQWQQHFFGGRRHHEMVGLHENGLVLLWYTKWVVLSVVLVSTRHDARALRCQIAPAADADAL